MGKFKDYDNNDVEYNNIENMVMLEDGTASVLLKKGRKAIIQINKMNDRFEAAIYRMVFGGPEAEREKKDVAARLSRHAAINDCLLEALGWVDGNPGVFIPEEIGELDGDREKIAPKKR